jgi:hypothetical protein
VKELMMGAQIKDLLEWVNVKHEKEQGKWVSLPQPSSMLNMGADKPIKEDPRRGGANQFRYPLTKFRREDMSL